MNATLTIEEFNSLLNSHKEESPLIQALRALMKIEKPEDVLALAETLSGWTGWGC
jgi:hypothetical protein